MGWSSEGPPCTCGKVSDNERDPHIRAMWVQGKSKVVGGGTGGGGKISNPLPAKMSDPLSLHTLLSFVLLEHKSSTNKAVLLESQCVTQVPT